MKKGKIIILLILAILLLGTLAWIFIPTSVQRQLTAVCRVEARSCYAVRLTSGDTLFLSLGDGPSLNASVYADSVCEKIDISGFFVSTKGHVLTSDSLLQRRNDTLQNAVLDYRLRNLDSLLTIQQSQRHDELKELDYYAHRHSVVDDGYNEVLTYREKVLNEVHHTDSTLKKVRQALDEKPRFAVVQSQFIVKSPVASANYPACRIHRNDGFLLLQLNRQTLPEGASRYSVHRLGAYPWRSRLLAFNDFGGPSAVRTPKFLPADTLFFPTTEGGAWVNPSGNLCGMQSNGKRQSSYRLAAFLHETHVWPVWWKENFQGWIETLQSEKEVSPSASVFPDSKDLICVRYAPTDSTLYEGSVLPHQVKGKYQRQGHGKMIFSDGTVYSGEWNADTLVSGKRVDSLGIFVGRFDARLQAYGSGRWYAHNGEYYEGVWKNDQRNGLGFSSKAGRIVHCGNWKNGSFKGERMVYTADRVYGIDISRYQHEVKRGIYRIDWSRLRITSLGSGRRVQGHVDYPVSFVYIKSTQGKSIYNRYYRNDLRQARRRGIAVGTYHFFSPFTKGAEQARHFLRRSSISAYDLPPVLDLEPTNAQVRQMGGDSLMFREVMVWLRMVEKSCGKRPVLYVSQNFVNRHLKNAPKALKDYDVWIARYGEYKPYVHLLHWQLTPYGRVRGIRGSVDINVYNGTKQQFQEYLKQHARPKASASH